MEKAKYNIYVTWNVKGITHKEEELDSVLYEKEIKIIAITEPKEKLGGYNGNKLLYSNIQWFKQKYMRTNGCNDLEL
jgi:hypothetical protein